MSVRSIWAPSEFTMTPTKSTLIRCWVVGGAAFVAALAVVVFNTRGPGDEASKGAPASDAKIATRKQGLRGGTIAAVAGAVVTKESHPVAMTGNQMSPEVARLIQATDLHSPLSYVARVTALHEIGRPLTREEWDVLKAFVLDSGTDGSVNIGQLRSLKNEAMAVMLYGESWSAEMADLLKAVHTAADQDHGVRDYALQFLAVLAEKDPAIGWGFHWQVAGGSDGEFAATASIHLLGAIQSGLLDSSQSERLGRQAFKLLTDPRQSSPVKATAMGVCAALHIQEIRPYAYAVSQDESAPLISRLAAIAALPELGRSDESRELLERISKSNNPRLVLAANQALARHAR